MSKYHGQGSEDSNPFFPTEDAYQGKDMSIYSPHGSIFGLPTSRTNVMDETLNSAMGLKGSFKGRVSPQGAGPDANQ